jgi:hypothetical protein
MELSCIITRKAFYLSWHLRLFLGAKALKHILSHPRCSAVGGQLDHPCLKYFVFHKESFLLVKFKYSKFYFFFFLVFRDRISLCSPGYPGTHFVDQAGLELIFFFFFFFFKSYLFIIICKYTVAVFGHSRRGHQIPLEMVVSHHVVAEN